MTARDVTVNACEFGCGGIWFDQLELKKLDEPHEYAGQVLLDLKRDPNVQVDVSKRRRCPKCKDVIMRQHFFSVQHKVTVDECPQCGGMWLDAGELSQIRALYKTEEERRRAAHAYFDDIFGKELAARKDANEAKLERARKIAHMFRFICPSYYIPGKQEWGAF